MHLMLVDEADEVQKPADLQPSRGFTEENPPGKKWKYRVSGSCVEENALLMKNSNRRPLS